MDNKSFLEKEIHQDTISHQHPQNLIKDVKEECISYDGLTNYFEENRDDPYNQNFNEVNKHKLSQLLTEISSLSAKEKLLFYFKLPGGISETDPLRQHQNPLGTRLEINHTINWIKSHLEHDPEVSIPKQDVYNDYSAYCRNANIKPLSTADFGKVMKQVFPDVKPRRLGTRGNSRYCYAAMRKVTKLTPPQISVMDPKTQSSQFFEEVDKDSWAAIKKWTEEVMHVSFESVKDLATYIKKNNLNALNPSKLMLQRKYMQRYNNKKKFTDISLKRKKKRKRKNSSNTDIMPTELPSSASPQLTLKVEEFSDSNNSFNGAAVSATTATLTPMNLAIESTEYQRSNSSNIFPESELNNSVDNSTSLSDVTMKNLTANPVNVDLFQNTKIKESLNQPLPIPTTVGVDILGDKNSTAVISSQQNLLQRNDDNSLMGPPQVQTNSELYNNNSYLRKRHILEVLQRNKALNTPNGNADQDTTNNDDKDVLLQNLGLPRERVISICNMDKHELDDYLPNIENPEQEDNEQDAELLQYFQTPEPTSSSVVTKTEDNIQVPVGNKNGIPSNNTTNLFPNPNLPQKQSLNAQNLVKKNTEAKQQVLFTTDSYVDEKPQLFRSDSSTAVTSIYSSVPTINHQQQRNSKISSSYSTRNRYNFVPISVTKSNNPTFNPKVTMNMNTNCPTTTASEYNTRMYNPVISASAPTSPNILIQKNMPCYTFDYIDKYDNSNMQTMMDSTSNLSTSLYKSISNENLELRSRSVPLNGPKIEELDSQSEYISDCNSVAHTPIPHEFNDFNEKLLLNGPDSSMDTTLNSIRTSHNIYIPSAQELSSNDLQTKMYENFAQKYCGFNAKNSITITRSNPTTPLPIHSMQTASPAAAATIQKPPALIVNFDTANINSTINTGDNSKMFDISKSMPTTPIQSDAMDMANIFRYSPPSSQDIKINQQQHMLGRSGIQQTNSTSGIGITNRMDFKKRRNFSIFNQYKDHHQQISGGIVPTGVNIEINPITSTTVTTTVTNLQDNLSTFINPDSTSEILKNL